MGLKNQIEMLNAKIESLKAFRDIRKKFNEKDVLLSNFELSDLEYEINFLEDLLYEMELELISKGK
jgi:hypothetical protein